ncbi:hypothetical protein MRX96_020594 [Rhipicephalus microplus]
MAAPQLDPSPMYDDETPVTSGMVKTPLSKLQKSSLWALIPMVVFLTFFTRPGRALPTSMVIPGVATRVTGVSSPFTIPKQGDGTGRKAPLRRRPQVPTGKSLNTTTKDIQQRPVICVFNAKYWRLQDTYLPDFIPVHYCTAILWYGYAVDVKDGSIVWKYPSAKTYKNSLLVMLYNGQLLHRGNNISVYFALGGAREDNANLSLMVGNPETRRRLVASVWLELNNPFQPWTSTLSSLKTHMHTANPSMRDVVRCSGDHSDAADVFNAALSSLPKTDDDWRLGYSISVAPETFVAPAAQLGGSRPGHGAVGQPDPSTRPVRAMRPVCQEKPVIRTNSHPLCLMVARQMENQNVLVATFSDERALMERMNLTYSSNMALAPVAVYDIDLDDFAGECGNGLSPLIRAVATGPG